MNSTSQQQQKSVLSHAQSTGRGGVVALLDDQLIRASGGVYRQIVYTDQHVQITQMTVPAGGDIDLEQHNGTSQILRVQEGECRVHWYTSSSGTDDDDGDDGDVTTTVDQQQQQQISAVLSKGAVFLIPAGTWHHIENWSRTQKLRLQSIYAPPVHAHHYAGQLSKRQRKRQRRNRTENHSVAGSSNEAAGTGDDDDDDDDSSDMLMIVPGPAENVKSLATAAKNQVTGAAAMAIDKAVGSADRAIEKTVESSCVIC
jgi:mannose-6-phosphate isomerase-like protein (cupin superfamily)